MAKINKTYAAFFNGVTEQGAELALDNQCKEMINCLPDIVRGIRKRPPSVYVTHQTPATNPNIATSRVIHSYDRGEDDEEYIVVATGSGTDPIAIYNKAGEPMVVEYNVADEASIKSYLTGTNLKGLTVQDRTWLFNKDTAVSLDYTATAPLKASYAKEAYFWLKRGSGDRYNPFNYAVYLNGTTFAVDPTKPSTGDVNPPTGAEDSDVAASLLAAKINASATWNCSVNGSILKITKADGNDFTFSSWDSWGNQASEGWKGSVNKITDLPKDMSFENVYVEISGSDNSNFTTYYVKWNGSSWEECLDPAADRGQLDNMPVAMDRTSITAGVATFTINKIEWSTPRVGNIDNNPDPTFINRKIKDVFFYKNRLGIASDDSVALTEAANYTNFYTTTAVDIVDTDMIDITVSTNQASNMYFAKPFNNSLYIFTKYAQYELTHDGAFSPSTVSIENVTNYPMKVDVEPLVMNDSLYFISVSDNRQQLREYIKTDTLSVTGVDLNIATPTYIDEPVVKLIADGVLGIVMCCTASGSAYIYNYKEDGSDRIQSAWSTWEFYPDVAGAEFEWAPVGGLVGVIYKTAGFYVYHTMAIDDKQTDNRYDTTVDQTDESVLKVPYKASILLPDYYPQISGIRTPLNKAQIKRVVVEGTGTFNSTVYRKDYDVTYNKFYNFSMKDKDFYVNSKVGNVDITIYDDTDDDFTISSIVVESLYQPLSKEMK